MQTEVTSALVYEAAKRIRPIAQRTPVLTSHAFDAESGVSAFFKCENLQKGGAFKIRGASNLIFSLSKSELAKGLIASSSGNHAQATAIAARISSSPTSRMSSANSPITAKVSRPGMGARRPSAMVSGFTSTRWPARKER